MFFFFLPWLMKMSSIYHSMIDKIIDRLASASLLFMTILIHKKTWVLRKNQLSLGCPSLTLTYFLFLTCFILICYDYDLHSSRQDNDQEDNLLELIENLATNVTLLKVSVEVFFAGCTWTKVLVRVVVVFSAPVECSALTPTLLPP